MTRCVKTREHITCNHEKNRQKKWSQRWHMLALGNQVFKVAIVNIQKVKNVHSKTLKSQLLRSHNPLPLYLGTGFQTT